MKVYSLPTERRVSQPSTEEVVEGAAICETLVTGMVVETNRFLGDLSCLSV